ncbi:core-2 i-branching beta-n-acetylglucosaminyltransferase family protein [Trifolium pratense]|uniref:Core-2 i-branching beta-n-acetylglucosaminyltransferase family protein n=1 Tax=Trifolium pratense TaxID=57577 RepID=A0A2K3NC13_TRIPR|nr:core-2 i-branching beta-n-acetylglucosaminyltransferase family protein [Trifolium pratense]
MAARTVKRRHVSTRLSCKLLILFTVSIFCVVVLVAAALFSVNSNSISNKPPIRISRAAVFHGPPKIAFLFLVRRNIPLDFLWGAFFQNGDVSNFSIYVHSAPGFVLDESNSRSHFFYGRQLSNSIQVS